MWIVKRYSHLQDVSLEFDIDSPFVQFGKELTVKSNLLNQSFSGIVGTKDVVFQSNNTPLETMGILKLIVKSGKRLQFKWDFQLNLPKEVYNKPFELELSVNGIKSATKFMPYLEHGEVHVKETDEAIVLRTKDQIIGDIKVNGEHFKAVNRDGNGISSFIKTQGQRYYDLLYNTFDGFKYKRIEIEEKEDVNFDLIPSLILRDGQRYKDRIIAVLNKGMTYNVGFSEDVMVYESDKKINSPKELKFAKQIGSGKVIKITPKEKINFYTAVKVYNKKRYIQDFRIHCR